MRRQSASWKTTEPWGSVSGRGVLMVGSCGVEVPAPAGHGRLPVRPVAAGLKRTQGLAGGCGVDAVQGGDQERGSSRQHPSHLPHRMCRSAFDDPVQINHAGAQGGLIEDIPVTVTCVGRGTRQQHQRRSADPQAAGRPRNRTLIFHLSHAHNVPCPPGTVQCFVASCIHCPMGRATALGKLLLLNFVVNHLLDPTFANPGENKSAGRAVG